MLNSNIPDKHPPSSRRKGVMLCYPFEERRLLKWRSAIYLQPKLDGERGRAILDDSVIFLSSEGHPQEHVDHLYDELRWLGKKLDPIELDGEIYTHGKANYDMNSIAGRQTAEFHVFDMVAALPFDRRYQILQKLSQTNLPPHIKIVPATCIAPYVDIISEYLDMCISEGYEGMIIRNANGLYERKRSTGIMKFKPHQTDIYTIIDTEMEHDIHSRPKHRLGAIVFTSDENNIGRVGSGFTAKQRQELWDIREALPGQYVRIKYQTLTPNHVPYHSVFIEIV